MGGQVMSERIEFFIRGRDLLPKPYRYEASGLDNVYLLNGVTERETSYGPMIHIANIHGLHRAIGLHIVEKSGLMTGAEFRFLRKQIGLSQAALAERMGVTDQTIANYEKGNVGSLGAADPLLRSMYLLHTLPEETRVQVLKRVVAREGAEKPKRVPEMPRRQIVGQWREQFDAHVAA
jgi:transcriptional regulator with XRE-family HTH domain